MIIRPLEMNDLPEVYDLIRAAATADHIRYVTREALRLAADPDRAQAETAVAVLPDTTDGSLHNVIAGFAWWDTLQRPSMPMEGWTHPQYRRKGIGTGLLVAAEAAVRRLGVERLTGRTFDTSPGAAALFRQRGFTEARRFNQMWIDLDTTDAQAQPILAAPEGFTVRTFRQTDTHALYEADTEVFSTHWGAQAQPFDAWRKRMMTDFDPALWQLVWDADQIAALCLGEPSAFGGIRDGWVAHLGVRPKYRGRGLGRFILLRGLRTLGQAGFERVGLHVDSENMPAIRLYESVGMRMTRQRIHFVKALRAAS